MVVFFSVQGFKGNLLKLAPLFDFFISRAQARRRQWCRPLKRDTKHEKKVDKERERGRTRMNPELLPSQFVNKDNDVDHLHRRMKEQMSIVQRAAKEVLMFMVVVFGWCSRNGKGFKGERK